MVVIQLGVPGGAELLIMGVFFLIIPFVMCYWVFTDAEDRGNENSALWALVVGALYFLTFFGGFLALAIYVWQRE